MSYPLHAPTTDPTVLFLRKRREEVRQELNRIDRDLDAVMPTPACRLCKVNACQGPFRWDVCGPCYNKHNGNPPEPEGAPSTFDPFAVLTAKQLEDRLAR